MSLESKFKKSYRCILASILFGAILISPACLGNEIDDITVFEEKTLGELSYCDDHPHSEASKRLLYVSTLDGKLSALDITKSGEVQWTVDTGEPLLSSSIHRLELTTNGRWVRMIPSLSGSLYKFDGHTIEAIKVKAEDLLKSSFKFSEDIVISGGIESTNYGVSTKTGKVLYECSAKGCANFTNEVDSNPDVPKHNSLLDDVMIVKRETQTVRAFDPRSGVERWNFSIGQHELELMKSQDCQSSQSKDELNLLLLDLEFKAIIPEGVICAFSKKNPSNILWMYRFDNPIVSAWKLDSEDKVEKIDFFSGVEWLWNGQLGLFTQDEKANHISPSLYLGMFEKQPYIQESTALKQITAEKYNNQQNVITDDNSAHILKIPFKPFPATREALALIEDHSKDPEEDDFDTVQILKDEPQNVLATSVLYASEYVNGNGFYFYTSNDLNETQKAVCDSENTTNKEQLLTGSSPENKFLSILMWLYSSAYKGKEVLFTLVAIYAIYMLATNARNERGLLYFEKPIEVPVPYAREAVEGVDYSKTDSFSSNSAADSSRTEATFQSRFATDFDIVQILGKGGFGVVFAVKNKIDDCHYAIKRIVLPTKQESRDRVMREVKTLANCEHQNIVRYFHAWIETPPPGWQEEHDKILKNQELLSTSIDICETPTEISSAPDYNRSSLGIVNRKYDKNNEWLLNLEKNSFNMHDLDVISSSKEHVTHDDDDSSGIQFAAHSASESPKKLNIEDSFVVFEDPSKDSPQKNNSGHQNGDIIVSITEDENTESKNISLSGEEPRICLDKKRRRQLSLNLASNGSTTFNQNMKIYLYIQMQLCQKHSLKEYLSKTTYMERKDQVIRIFEQIVCAVEYVHLKGLIHRDLKPSNIFFALDGKIKIGDFGLVTDMAEDPTPTTESSSSSSNSNSIKHTQQVGTTLYMSPEQATGLAYNYKVDIYSLGIILFELLVTFSTEMERINTLKDLRSNKFPNDFPITFYNEYELLKLMLSCNPSERLTTFGIRARPPLLHSVTNSEHHFELPPRQRRESQNNMSQTNFFTT